MRSVFTLFVGVGLASTLSAPASAAVFDVLEFETLLRVPYQADVTQTNPPQGVYAANSLRSLRLYAGATSWADVDIEGSARCEATWSSNSLTVANAARTSLTRTSLEYGDGPSDWSGDGVQSASRMSMLIRINEPVVAHFAWQYSSGTSGEGEAWPIGYSFDFEKLNADGTVNQSERWHYTSTTPTRALTPGLARISYCGSSAFVQWGSAGRAPATCAAFFQQTATITFIPSPPVIVMIAPVVMFAATRRRN